MPFSKSLSSSPSHIPPPGTHTLSNSKVFAQVKSDDHSLTPSCLCFPTPRFVIMLPFIHISPPANQLKAEYRPTTPPTNQPTKPSQGREKEKKANRSTTQPSTSKSIITQPSMITIKLTATVQSIRSKKKPPQGSRQNKKIRIEHKARICPGASSSLKRH